MFVPTFALFNVPGREVLRVAVCPATPVKSVLDPVRTRLAFPSYTFDPVVAAERMAFEIVATTELENPARR
jgi:hypothetical protein